MISYQCQCPVCCPIGCPTNGYLGGYWRLESTDEEEAQARDEIKRLRNEVHDHN